MIVRAWQEHGGEGARYYVFAMFACSQSYWKAPFNRGAACKKRKGVVEPNQSIMPDNYYKGAPMHALFTEVLRCRNDAYVAHNIIRCTIPNIPLNFTKRFMAHVASKDRLESAKALDKEGPRVLAKNLKNNKT